MISNKSRRQTAGTASARHSSKSRISSAPTFSSSHISFINTGECFSHCTHTQTRTHTHKYRFLYCYKETHTFFEDPKKALVGKTSRFPKDLTKVLARKNVLAHLAQGTKMSPQVRSHNTQIIQRACSRMCN